VTRAIVVTGTDTDIGKTVFAAGLTAALNAHYWKPVQAGLDGDSDTQSVMRLAGVGPERVVSEIYRLTTPCSPHRAAEIDGVTIEAGRLALPFIDGALVIEGAGGALVPLTRELLYADLMTRWLAPTVIVARTELGTINHSLMTIEALRRRGVPIRGIAFVGEPAPDSEATIASISGVRRLGRLPWLDPLDATTLATAFAANFDSADFA
jgi:dethiobiotin synthetase